jgi:hypothetical protein
MNSSKQLKKQQALRRTKILLPWKEQVSRLKGKKVIALKAMFNRRQTVRRMADGRATFFFFRKNQYFSDKNS